jgi:hypothetical protein
MPVPSAASGPFPDQPSAGPASSNPFAEAGTYPPQLSSAVGAGDALNPYAAPLGLDAQFQPQAAGGLPWENQPMGLGTWWQTAKWCLSEPSSAFAALRPGGDTGRAVLFCALGLLIGGVAQMVWVLPITVLGALFDQDQAMVVVQIVVQVVQTLLGAAIGATVGLFIGAAIMHVALLLVGGANRPFETTLRVLAYVNGSTAWLSIIPCVGPLVALIWSLVMEVAGLAAAHQTSQGRALLAVLLPIFVCGLLCGLGVAVIFIAIAQQGGAF